MKNLRPRLTYANAMSTLAVFLVLGGASAFAASQLARNSVGTKQLKKNAVTAAKIKKGAVRGAKVKDDAITGAKVQADSLGGADVAESTLGTVPSAATAASATRAASAERAALADTATSADRAASAERLAGRIPISTFTPAGTRPLATVGPFTIAAECRIGAEGSDSGRFLISTSVDGASMDDTSVPQQPSFDVADSPAELFAQAVASGAPGIEVAPSPGTTAVAPSGVTIRLQNQTIGFNIAGHPGQCYFAGLVEAAG